MQFYYSKWSIESIIVWSDDEVQLYEQNVLNEHYQ